MSTRHQRRERRGNCPAADGDRRLSLLRHAVDRRSRLPSGGTGRDARGRTRRGQARRRTDRVVLQHRGAAPGLLYERHESSDLRARRCRPQISLKIEVERRVNDSLAGPTMRSAGERPPGLEGARRASGPLLDRRQRLSVPRSAVRGTRRTRPATAKDREDRWDRCVPIGGSAARGQHRSDVMRQHRPHRRVEQADQVRIGDAVLAGVV